MKGEGKMRAAVVAGWGEGRGFGVSAQQIHTGTPETMADDECKATCWLNNNTNHYPETPVLCSAAGLSPVALL
jgi:hypothetical protein